MGKIYNVLRVWDNGVISPTFKEIIKLAPDDPLAWLDGFESRTGAKYDIATRWEYLGKIYEDTHCPIPIPDMSGLVYCTKDWKEWVVLNPDGTEKLRIGVPRLSELARPEEGYMGDPDYWEGMPKHLMYSEGSDGYYEDARIFFNMHTGEVDHFERVGRHW